LSISRLLSAIILLSLLPALAFAAQAPPLKNAGFEADDLGGWKTMPNPPEGVIIGPVKTHQRGGKHAMKVAGPEGANPWLAQGLPDLIPHATYLLAAYVQHGEGAGHAAVKLEFYDAENKYLAGYYGLEPPQPTGDWTEVSVRAEAPENAAKAAVILRLIGAGAAYFDDVSFAMVAPPPPLILTPPRVMAPAQAGAKVSLTAALSATAEVSGDPQAFIVGSGAEKPQKAALTAARGAGGRSLNLEVTLPALAPGFYRLQVGWPKVTPAVVDLLLLPSGKRPAGIDEKAHFLQDGKPYLPLGVYHVKPEDFSAVAAAGFNLAQIAPPGNAEELKAAVAAAQAAKLRLLVPLYPGLASRAAAEAAAALVKEFAEEATVFGWLLADQPEERPDLTGPVTELYLRVRQADANHPALVACGPQADLSAWAPLCDALLVQAFPRVGDEAALTKRLDRAGDAVRETQPWAAVLAAGWPGQDPPAVEQARAWLYRAIVDGSTGALWFSLREGSWDLTVSPLWAELPRLNAEAAELALAFQEGEALGKLEVSVQQVSAQAVTQGGRVYLVLLNSSANPLQGAVRLPVAVTKGEYLDGSEAKAQSRTVRFDLPANGARAIRLTLAPAAEQPPQPTEPEKVEPSEEAEP
jgi:hypothetical protein